MKSSNVSDFQPQSWQTSSNEALKISLIGKDVQAGAIQFPPTFTYPIFGDDETIYGYKDLVIHLVFDSITYKPFLNVKYSEKLNDAIDPQTDIIDKITPFLPANDYILRDELQWVDSFHSERESFNLMLLCEKIDEYKKEDKSYGIYRVPIGELIQKDKDSPLIKFWLRIQIFTLLYIEAATYLNLEDEPRWVIYLLFNEEDQTLIGFVTTYSYWDYQGHESFDNKATKLKFNEKISQFLIMPPYQELGHGSSLYQSLYSYWFKQDTVSCITVEDPNEQFDDLRDRNDLKILSSTGFFEELKKKCMDEQEVKFVSDEWIELKRQEYKFEKRQFNRLIEMILLIEKKNMLFIRQVKRRIWLKNYDSLCELEDSEQQYKAINDSYLLVKEDYERIIQACKF